MQHLTDETQDLYQVSDHQKLPNQWWTDMINFVNSCTHFATDLQQPWLLFFKSNSYITSPYEVQQQQQQNAITSGADLSCYLTGLTPRSNVKHTPNCRE